MPSSPLWKVYANDVYLAAIKDPVDVALFVGAKADASPKAHVDVRYGHTVKVWQEGQETITARESPKEAAKIMRSRVFGASTTSARAA